jgi:uroporphyrinogen III methyltransferase/synthase
VNATPASSTPPTGEPRPRESVRPASAGRIALVGAGPGDDRLLTLRAAQLLGQADLVISRREPGPRVRELIAPGADVVVLTGTGTGTGASTDADAEAALGTEPAPRTEAGPVAEPDLIAAAQSGQLVVRLYDGDPLLDGGVPAARSLAAAGVPFEVVPGIPAATAVPAYAGIPLGRDGGEIRVIQAADASRVTFGPGSLVVLGAEAGPADLGKMLIAAGWPDTTPFAITWDGTTTAQRTVTSTLGRITADLKAAGVSPVNAGEAVAVVGDAAAAQPELSWYETKPLFGWRVLVPRTKADAAAVSEQLREQGAIPEEVPTIAVEPPRTPQQMDRAVRGLVTGRYQWVAFTSVNAVRAIREKFEEYGLDARAFAGVKVAAVGDQTAAALKDFGIAPDLVPDGEQSGQGLAAAWPPYDDVLDPINRVLLPRADIATENLVARLTELGWEAEDVTAYRTVRAAPPAASIREAIKGGGFDAVLFTSSSTVRNLVGIAGKPHAVTVIAVIGPQTAKTAAEFGLRVDVMAPTPSMPVLVEALAEFGANQRRAALEAGEPLRKPSERRRGARKRIR